MKKNININMFGRLYAIDEDAYNLLRTYEDSLRSYFGTREGGQEIVDDIEARIAELFDAYLTEGHETIPIEQMQQIILRLGNPQQMDEEATADSADYEEVADDMAQEVSEQQSIYDRLFRSGRHLYRDTTGKLFTGLLSGVARFLEVDPVVVRFGFLALLLLTFSFGKLFHLYGFGEAVIAFGIAYLVLSFIVPAASSPQDRLKQQGRKVTPEHLAQQVAEESKCQQQEDAPDNKPTGGCLPALLRGIAIIVGLFIIIAFIGEAIGVLIWIGVLVWILALRTPDTDSVGNLFFQTFQDMPWVSVLHIIACVGLAIAPLYCIIHYLLSRARRVQGMGGGQRLAWVVVFVASLVGVIVTGTMLTINFQQLQDKEFNESRARDDRYNTMLYMGHELNAAEAKYLMANDWQIVRMERCQKDRVTQTGQYYNGDGHTRYLNCYNADGRQTYRVERTDTLLANTTYSLTANVRADGRGAYVYAIADGRTYMVEIPVNGNERGTLWAEADSIVNKWKETHDNDDDMDHDTRGARDIAMVNHGKGYGWNRVEIRGIKSRNGQVTYGVAVDPSFTGSVFAGTWFSAADFRLSAE